MLDRLLLEYRVQYILFEKLLTHDIELKESIDIDKVESIDIEPEIKSYFNYGENKYGIRLQKIGEYEKDILSEDMLDYFNNKKYYNFGFDFNDESGKLGDMSYKEIAKPLAIVIKSLNDWIIKNKPDFILIFTEGKNSTKKLNLYDIILHREDNRIKSLGYDYNFMESPLLGDCIGIFKN